MVYIHGGAWVIGEKREQGKPMMYELVARGWVCVAINYRLSPKATWPDHIVDAKRAVAWVKEHIAEYGGDPSFVAVSGGSAGGHLCALLALTRGRPRLPARLRGGRHLGRCLRPLLRRHGHDRLDEGIGRYGPGLLELLEKRVMKTSRRPSTPRCSATPRPPTGCTPDAPPFFVLHGPNDTLVPVDVARTFVAALRAVSRQPVAYAELPLAQHAFDVLASLRCQATTAGVAAFLEAARGRRGRAAGGPRPARPPDREVSDIVSETRV